MSTNCPNCGNEYERIGQHFARGRCDHPELSDRQRGVLTYLIFRGVEVRRDGANPRLGVFSTDETFIREMADALGWVANEPRVHESAGDAYERMAERRPSVNFERENFSDVWAVSTISHPAFEDLSEPADVDRLAPATLRWVLETVGTWVGLLFGSLHIDLRGWDVTGEQFRRVLANHGVPTAEYDGEGYAEDDFTRRYHWSDDVVATPHYSGLDVLEYVGLSVNDVAEPIKLRG